MGVLGSFEAERSRVDQLVERDIYVRCNRPQNPHAPARMAVLCAVNELLGGRDLLGFHCTNLHPAELSSITRDGLFPLSPDMAARRVRARIAAGDFPEPVGARLLAESKASEKNRSGKLWFILTKSTLKCLSGVYRLLTYWGGEALYMPHERDPAIADVLLRTGRPTIVEVAIPIQYLECFMSVGERLLAGYLSRRAVETDHGTEFEGYTTMRIVGPKVRRVIGPKDSDFAKLTGRNPRDWPRPAPPTLSPYPIRTRL